MSFFEYLPEEGLVESERMIKEGYNASYIREKMYKKYRVVLSESSINEYGNKRLLSVEKGPIPKSYLQGMLRDPDHKAYHLLRRFCEVNMAQKQMAREFKKHGYSVSWSTILKSIKAQGIPYENLPCGGRYKDIKDY